MATVLKKTNERRVEFKYGVKGDFESLTIGGKPLERWEEGEFWAFGTDLKDIRLAQLPPKLKLVTCSRRDRLPQLLVTDIEVVNATTANVQIRYAVCPTCWDRPGKAEEHINDVAKFMVRMGKKQKEIRAVYVEVDFPEVGVRYEVQVTGQRIEDIIVQAKAVFNPVQEHFIQQLEMDDANRPKH
jgi:hypothetical protein